MPKAACDGNLIQEGSGDGDYKYAYDYRSRLIEVKEYQTDTWNTVAEYRYDAAGRRVLKVVTNSGDLNGTTRYLWGGQSDWQCLEELDGSDDIVARYTYAPGYIDAVACQERDLNSDGDFADSGEVVYYHSTTLYSVYALSDSNESVVERYRYDAYGEASVLDADHSSDADGASDAGNPYLYTGRRLDAESGLMQYRHRYYSTGLGRFVSRDPVGYVDAMHLYLYCVSNPANGMDPAGLRSHYTYRERRCIADSKKECKGKYGWYNPQRYACTSYCDNACTGTPDVIDRTLDTVFAPCPIVRKFLDAPGTDCVCAALQVADILRVLCFRRNWTNAPWELVCNSPWKGAVCGEATTVLRKAEGGGPPAAPAGGAVGLGCVR